MRSREPRAGLAKPLSDGIGYHADLDWVVISDWTARTGGLTRPIDLQIQQMETIDVWPSERYYVIEVDRLPKFEQFARIFAIIAYRSRSAESEKLSGTPLAFGRSKPLRADSNSFWRKYSVAGQPLLDWMTISRPFSQSLQSLKVNSSQKSKHSRLVGHIEDPPLQKPTKPNSRHWLAPGRKQTPPRERASWLKSWRTRAADPSVTEGERNF